jgi:hypothetical protein
MVKVKCLRGTVASGGKTLEVGKSYEISESDFNYLSVRGKVEKATIKATVKK